MHRRTAVACCDKGQLPVVDIEARAQHANGLQWFVARPRKDRCLNVTDGQRDAGPVKSEDGPAMDGFDEAGSDDFGDNRSLRR
jgi:hypothetical protein